MTEQRLDSIEQLRARIDQIDEQILLLLNERAECALDVAKVKMQESVLEISHLRKFASHNCHA